MSQECYLAVTFLSGAGGLVEAEPFHITNQHVDNAPLELPIAARGVAHAPLHERRHAPVRHVRLGLQDRGQSNFRRHFLRGLRRFATLLVGDLASFYIMRDRKSTRLNSSHTVISYAVFCLKKKKQT